MMMGRYSLRYWMSDGSVRDIPGRFKSVDSALCNARFNVGKRDYLAKRPIYYGAADVREHKGDAVVRVAARWE